uniref:Uncharacterized protein n=1 Tax=Ananas comosus var. bracteatus TaxID=296719 RepID=A0A6V7P378_ANACO|nr:unnamed protein product [Ananas comosus var. bracteatus]
MKYRWAVVRGGSGCSLSDVVFRSLRACHVITRDPLRCRPRFAIAIAIAASPWYSPPPFNPPPDPLILTVSRAIAASPDVSLDASLGSLLPSLSANLVVSLLSLNPSPCLLSPSCPSSIGSPLIPTFATLRSLSCLWPISYSPTASPLPLPLSSASLWPDVDVTPPTHFSPLPSRPPLLRPLTRPSSPPSLLNTPVLISSPMPSNAYAWLSSISSACHLMHAPIFSTV